jgi:ABC-type lipoprotein release transport system permease subunit
VLGRQRYLLDHALGSLARRRGRNAALLAVYAAVVFLLASVMLFASALRGEAARLLADAPELTVQRLVAGRHDLMPAGYLDRVAGIRGVASVRGRLWGYYYDPVSRANYTVTAADPTVGASVLANGAAPGPSRPEVAPTGEPTPSRPGAAPAADAASARANAATAGAPARSQAGASPTPGAALLGRGVARSRGLAPGDYLSFRDAAGAPFPLRVAGLLERASELVSTDLVLVTEGDFRRLLGVPEGTFTDLALRVRNPREVRTVAEKVTRALPDTRPVTREEVLRTYDAVFAWREGIGLLLVTGALLAFVIFAWDRAAGLSAEERREVGILKAIGWETGDVLQMKLLEGAAVSVTAFLLGLGAAYVHVFWGGAPLLAPVLKGWATLYPAFQLPPRVAPLEVGTLFALTVLPYTAATLVPTWRAAITDPDAVMRGLGA